MIKTVDAQVARSNKTFSASETESFTRIITTPLKSRKLRPHFGSLLHELIDKVMDRKWILLFRKYLFECFFDETGSPWDERLVPRSLTVQSVNTTTGSVVAQINFEGFEIQTALGGF